MDMCTGRGGNMCTARLCKWIRYPSACQRPKKITPVYVPHLGSFEFVGGTYTVMIFANATAAVCCHTVYRHFHYQQLVSTFVQPVACMSSFIIYCPARAGIAPSESSRAVQGVCGSTALQLSLGAASCIEFFLSPFGPNFKLNGEKKNSIQRGLQWQRLRY